MRINYNVSSIIARNALNNNDSSLTISTQKLSSGNKINSAKDDAAGLAIARKMNMQIRSLERAGDNAQDGLSVTDTADGAMSEIHSILQRMNELAVQAANGTNSDTDRSQIQIEIDELVDEIDRISDTTQFNAQNLLDGSFAYKGYTNSENVKVMSYSKEVNMGTYAIDELEYYRYGDETITYASDGHTEVLTDVDYRIKSADDVKDALNMTDYDEYGIKGFPTGTRVSIDDEYVYIEDDQGFEMKLYVNDRKNVTPVSTSSVTIPNAFTANSIIATTSIPNNVTVEKYTYNNITVVDDNGEQYKIDSLIQEIEDGNTSVYSDSRTKTLLDLEDDLELENITDVQITTANNVTTITVDYLDDDGNKKTNNYTVENKVNGNGIDDYLYSTSERVRTDYTVGEKDNPLTINVTKMGAMLIQTGANEGQQLEMEIPEVSARTLGVNGLSVSTEDDATGAIDKVGNAINQLSAIRSKIGAYANRLEHTVANINTADEKMTEAYSRIMDVDMAEEMTNYANLQVLVQASTSVLAQANERPQQVLQLLQ